MPVESSLLSKYEHLPIYKVPLTSIAVINRHRKKMDPLRVAELADSIRQNSLLHPISIRAPFPHERELAGGKPFVLIVGGRRYAAHVFLNRSHIESRVIEGLNPLDAEILELDENLRRVDIEWLEQVEARERIHVLRMQLDPTHTAAKTAEELNITPAQMSRDLALMKEIKRDPSLRKAKKKGAAVRMVDHRKHVAQRQASAAKTGVSIQDLRQKIVHADARDWIRTIPTASVDLVFTDPPWGIDADKQLTDSTNAKGVYDDDNEKAWDLITDLVPHWIRVTKESGWIVSFMADEGYEALASLIRNCCTSCFEYVDSLGLCACDRISARKNSLIPESPRWLWIRENSTNNGHWPELHAANRYEPLLVANRGKGKLIKKPVTNVLRFDAVYKHKDRDHFMQKPHPLCREIIERCTIQGETVLDSTCGSGAHLAAAADLARDILGCDSGLDSVESAIANVAQYYKPEAVRWAIERGRKASLETTMELAK